MATNTNLEMTETPNNNEKNNNRKMSAIVVKAQMDEMKGKKVEWIAIPLLLVILLSYGAYQIYRTRTEKSTHTDIMESGGVEVPYLFITASSNISHMEIQSIQLNGDEDILSDALSVQIPNVYDFDMIYTETISEVSKTDWNIFYSKSNSSNGEYVNLTDGFLIVPPDDGTKLTKHLSVSILVYTEDHYEYGEDLNLTDDDAQSIFFDYLLSGLDYGVFWEANTLESLVNPDDSIEDKTISSGDMHFSFISSFSVNSLTRWEEFDKTTEKADSIYYTSKLNTEVTDFRLSKIKLDLPDYAYLIQLEFVETLSAKKFVLTTTWLRNWTDTVSDTLAIHKTVGLLIAFCIAKFLRGIKCGDKIIYKGYAPNYYIIDEETKKKLDVYLAEKGIIGQNELVELPDELK